MRFRNTARIALAALICIIPSVSLRGNSSAPDDECVRTTYLQTYSNAVFSEETGDVVGYELAIQKLNGGAIEALLYDYEGVPNEEGIGVSGRISGKRLTMEGKWVRHVIEQPTEKEVVETRLVEVNGMLNSSEFRGTIKIQDLAKPIGVRMKRVDHIWMCKR
jgi:hypothetical protein